MKFLTNQTYITFPSSIFKIGLFFVRYLALLVIHIEFVLEKSIAINTYRD